MIQTSNNPWVLKLSVNHQRISGIDDQDKCESTLRYLESIVPDQDPDRRHWGEYEDPVGCLGQEIYQDSFPDSVVEGTKGLDKAVSAAMNVASYFERYRCNSITEEGLKFFYDKLVSHELIESMIELHGDDTLKNMDLEESR